MKLVKHSDQLHAIVLSVRDDALLHGRMLMSTNEIEELLHIPPTAFEAQRRDSRGAGFAARQCYITGDGYEMLGNSAVRGTDGVVVRLFAPADVGFLSAKLLMHFNSTKNLPALDLKPQIRQALLSGEAVLERRHVSYSPARDQIDVRLWFRRPDGEAFCLSQSLNQNVYAKGIVR